MNRFIFAAIAAACATAAISCGKTEETVPEPALTTENESLSFGSEGGSLEFTVKSNVQFRVMESSDWFEVDPAEGSSDATITVTALANEGTDERTSSITIASDEIADRITITVTQAGVEAAHFSVTPDTSVDVPYSGGEYEFNITSNSAWSLACESWMSADITSGDADAKVKVTVAENADPAQRSGKLTFTCEAAAKTVEIAFTQKGKEAENSVTDIEGNTYKTVEINGMVWMAENLRSTKFNDGEDITYVEYQEDYLELWDEGAWHLALDKPAYTFYESNEEYRDLYGYLYNYEVAKDPRICPEGWHVPTKDEWTALADAAGGKSTAATKLKSTSGWDTVQGVDGNGTDEFGFNALPGGDISEWGGCAYVGQQGFWWTSTDIGSGYVFYVNLVSHKEEIYIEYASCLRGISIRCVKD